MITSWLLTLPALVLSLLVGPLLFSAIIVATSAEPEATGCDYNIAAFNTIRHQSRLARQAGRHDKATVLDFAAAILRCQPEELERRLAEAMSEVWNSDLEPSIGIGHIPGCPRGFKWMEVKTFGRRYDCCRPRGNEMACLGMPEGRDTEKGTP